MADSTRLTELQTEQRRFTEFMNDSTSQQRKLSEFIDEANGRFTKLENLMETVWLKLVNLEKRFGSSSSGEKLDLPQIQQSPFFSPRFEGSDAQRLGGLKQDLRGDVLVRKPDSVLLKQDLCQDALIQKSDSNLQARKLKELFVDLSGFSDELRSSKTSSLAQYPTVIRMATSPGEPLTTQTLYGIKSQIQHEWAPLDFSTEDDASTKHLPSFLVVINSNCSKNTLSVYLSVNLWENVLLQVLDRLNFILVYDPGDVRSKEELKLVETIYPITAIFFKVPNIVLLLSPMALRFWPLFGMPFQPLHPNLEEHISFIACFDKYTYIIWTSYAINSNLRKLVVRYKLQWMLVSSCGMNNFSLQHILTRWAYKYFDFEAFDMLPWCISVEICMVLNCGIYSDFVMGRLCHHLAMKFHKAAASDIHLIFYEHFTEWEYLLIGSLFYVIRFIVSFPMSVRIDEISEYYWDLSRIVVDALGSPMLVTILLNLWHTRVAIEGTQAKQLRTDNLHILMTCDFGPKFLVYFTPMEIQCLPPVISHDWLYSCLLPYFNYSCEVPRNYMSGSFLLILRPVRTCTGFLVAAIQQEMFTHDFAIALQVNNYDMELVSLTEGEYCLHQTILFASTVESSLLCLYGKGNAHRKYTIMVLYLDKVGEDKTDTFTCAMHQYCFCTQQAEHEIISAVAPPRHWVMYMTLLVHLSLVRWNGLDPPTYITWAALQVNFSNLDLEGKVHFNEGGNVMFMKYWATIKQQGGLLKEGLKETKGRKMIFGQFNILSATMVIAQMSGMHPFMSEVCHGNVIDMSSSLSSVPLCFFQSMWPTMLQQERALEYDLMLWQLQFLLCIAFISCHGLLLLLLLLDRWLLATVSTLRLRPLSVDGFSHPTWMKAEDLMTLYCNLDLEDKVYFNGGSNVMTQRQWAQRRLQKKAQS